MLGMDAKNIVFAAFNQPSSPSFHRLKNSYSIFPKWSTEGSFLSSDPTGVIYAIGHLGKSEAP
jgi:hypothetical protein